jgi:class 3 adenylate cyclase
VRIGFAGRRAGRPARPTVFVRRRVSRQGHAKPEQRAPDAEAKPWPVPRDRSGHGWRWVFATFDGPARGVRCAHAIGDAVRDFGLEVRAGVHTGEVERIAGKVGIAVSVGARIAALAAPSEVLVSQTVRDLVSGSGLTFEDAGEHELKGVPDRWHLYRLVG